MEQLNRWELLVQKKTLGLDELQQLRWEAILRNGDFSPQSWRWILEFLLSKKRAPQNSEKKHTTFAKSANDDFFQVGVHNKLISFLFYSIDVPVKRFHNLFFLVGGYGGWWGARSYNTPFEWVNTCC